MFFVSLLSITFVSLQISWVINEGFEKVLTAEAVGWLIFDWINALAYFLFVRIIQIFIQWKKAACCNCSFTNNCNRRCEVNRVP